MRRLLLFLYLCSQSICVIAQSLPSETGYVRFFSSALIEDITAENHHATALFDPTTGEAVFLIPIAGFEFRKSLMREHFNENYMESTKFPEAFFKGKITGYQPGGRESDATAEGDLMIHGVTKAVRIPGKITHQQERIKMEAVFMVALKDYSIEIPQLMFQKIAEEVEVSVKFEFIPNQP